MTLEQEIIKLVKLSTTKSIGDADFSSPWISIGSRSLIRIKYVSKLAKYIGQLFISILTLMGLDYERVEDMGLLAVIVLVIGLVGASSQLGSLFTVMILGPGTGKAIQLGWIVLEEDLGDEQPPWQIHLEHYGIFGR